MDKDLNVAFDEIDQYIKDNLYEICEELLDWDRTGVLKGNHMNELRKIYPPFKDQLIKELVHSAAMKMVINLYDFILSTK